MTIPQVRRVAGDPFAVRLLHKINTATAISPRGCPFCLQPMEQFQITKPPMTLDACKSCKLVWFDSGEFEEVPEGVLETTDELELRGREAFAMNRLEELKEQQRRQGLITGEPPDENWKWIPAFFGYPVKIEPAGLSCWPWLTWSLATITAILSIWALFDLENVVHRFGLIPAEAWRYGGATLLTSFFLHGGVGHLVGNLYFLLLFGDNVEDYLGRRRFIGLIILSTVVGNCLHIIANPHSTVPCIGASGGISGIITFYALEFPRTRLGFFVMLRLSIGWVQVSAWAALLMWLVYQGFITYAQTTGLLRISGFAHLGGAVAGLALWLVWRNLEQKSNRADS